MRKKKFVFWGTFQFFVTQKFRFLAIATLGLILTFSIPLLAHEKNEQLKFELNCAGIQDFCFVASSPQSSAEMLLQRGMDAYKVERFAEAVELWKKALQEFPETSLNQALTLNYLSLAYQQLDQWQPAEEAILKSLDFLNSNKSQEKLPILARTLITSGRLQLALGKPQLALETLQLATKTYQKIGDEEGKIGSLINQAQALQDLGYYRQSLKTLEIVQSNLGNQPDAVKITGLLSLGNLLRKVGDLERSWCVLQKGLAVAKRAQSPQLIANISLSLGETARMLGNQDKEQYKNIVFGQQNSPLTISEACNDSPKITSNALGFYRQAQAFYRQVHETAPTSSLISIQASLQLLNVSQIIVETKTWENDWLPALEEAYKLLPQLQAQIRDLAPSRQGIYFQLILAESLAKFKQLAQLSDFNDQSFNFPSDEELEQLLQTAIQQAKNLKDARAESYSLGYLGKFYEQNQLWINARKYTEAGLNQSQSIFASNITYQWQWQLGRILKAQGNISDAITAYTEAVNSLQDIRQNLVAIDLNLAGIKSDFQFDFQEKVEPVYRQLFDLLLTSGEPENLKTAISVMELFQVAELETFLKCRLLPSNRVQKLNTVQVTEQALEKKLEEIHKLDPTAALIYPIILDDRIEVIISFFEGSIKHYSHFIDKKKVETVLFNLRENLAISKTPIPEKQIQRDSQEVYEWLLKQPEAALIEKNVKTLVFVLDGSLRNIPMPALYNPTKKQYLVKDYVTAISPGLLQLNLKHFDWKNLKILLAGRTSNAPNQGFPNILPAVKAELIGIQKTFSNPKLFLDEKFIWNNVKNSLKNSNFSILHIATHGKFSSNRQETFILDFENQPLNMDNLDSLFPDEDPIELLTFSACETAKGDNRAVLGLAGLAIKSQALSTLAGLWKLDDNLSAPLMIQFYEQLKTSETKAKAFNAAQQKLLEPSSEFKHPSFWSPYIIVGNWL